MVPAAEALSRELAQEAKATRRLLAAVPEDKLSWSPHPKSMTLQALASHIARIPALFAQALRGPGLDVGAQRPPAPPLTTTAEIVATMDQSVAAAQAFLAEVSEEAAQGPWRVAHGERELFTLPRLAIVRTMVLNHWYHHRGQLSVYLRLLEVPVPATYGRSADEDFVTAADRRAS